MAGQTNLHLLIMLVRGYQLTLSPGLARMRLPSCSQYCIDALQWRDDGHG